MLYESWTQATGTIAIRVEIATGAQRQVPGSIPQCISSTGSRILALTTAGVLVVHDFDTATSTPISLGATAGVLLGNSASYACNSDLTRILVATTSELIFHDRGTGQTVNHTLAGDFAPTHRPQMHYFKSDNRRVVVQTIQPFELDVLTGQRQALNAPPLNTGLLSGGRFGTTWATTTGFPVYDLELGALFTAKGISGDASGPAILGSNGVLAFVSSSSSHQLGCECRSYVLDMLTGRQFSFPSTFAGQGFLDPYRLTLRSLFTPDSRWLLVSRETAGGIRTWHRFELPTSPAGAGGVVELQIAGRGGVPVGAAAAVLNVTVIDAATPGFVTVWPCGSPQPMTSSLNYRSGQTVPNTVITRIGSGGRVCLYSLAGAHLAVDVNGYFPDDATYSSIQPARLLDSRPGTITTDGQFAGIGLRPAGSVTELTVASRGGVSTTAATAVLNITVADPAVAGHITVWPCGEPQPNTSNLNFTAGQTVPNAVISKIGASGKVCIYTLSATHLLADVTGYFPTQTSYISLLPKRLLDSRPGTITDDGQFAGIGYRQTGTVTELTIAGRGGVPATAASVALNITAADALAPGFVTAWPCGETRPTTSNVNYITNQAVPNSAIVKIGAGGKVCLYTSATTHLLADVTGYFGDQTSFTALVPGRLLDSRSNLGRW